MFMYYGLFLLNYLPHTIMGFAFSVVLTLSLWGLHILRGNYGRSVSFRPTFRCIVGAVALVYSSVMMCFCLCVWLIMLFKPLLHDSSASGIAFFFLLLEPMMWHPVSLLMYGIGVIELRRRFVA